jgi:hypothetical protein
MPDQPRPEPKQPSSEPKSFQTPSTPESRDLEKQDKAHAHGRPEDVPEEADPHTEEQLDHGLKETFPASDPVSINPGAD